MALIGVVIVLFGVPLIPALLELRGGRKADPIFIDAAGSALIPRTGEHLDETGGPWPVRVKAGGAFHRIQGSYIHFGAAPPSLAVVLSGQTPVKPYVAFDETPTHSKDVRLTKGEMLYGNQVVHGNLVMHAGSRIVGNVKVHGEARIGEDCTISGSLFCLRNVRAKERVQLLGPVAVNGYLRLGTHSVLGSPEYPISVSARLIQLGDGSRAHGVVRALERGRVVPARWKQTSKPDSSR
ncbi:MAG: hypothetical protein Q4A92_11090 [Corynebacterium sp.]|nr:hypothetical protein [Corynebacterium sp.]